MNTSEMNVGCRAVEVTGTNVGCRAVEVRDTIQGVPVPLWLLYPTRAAAQPERFGPYGLDLAMNAPVEGAGLAVVAISHGGGGSPWVHRDLALFLARSGFVVALLEHPGDSRSGSQLAGTPANLENRPRHLRLAIDAAFADNSLRGHLSSEVFVIGQSMGGYTALAAAGGQPSALPHETSDGLAHPVSVTPDPRIRALVLLTPATPWFMLEGSLSRVTVPILLRTAERDEMTPPAHVELVLGGLPDPKKVDHKIIPGAGHFSFHSPFPVAMTGPHFPPSQDPPGFDRVAFQPVIHAEILDFLRGQLPA